MRRKGWLARWRLLNASYDASEDGPGTTRPPPGIGQHTDAILAEIGYSEAEIGALRAAGAI